MASADSKEYLANGGYFQKGTEANLCEADLEKEVQDLPLSRQVPRQAGFHMMVNYLLMTFPQMVSRRKDIPARKTSYLLQSKIKIKTFKYGKGVS